MNDRSKMLVDATRRLLRRRAFAHLRKIVNKSHMADLTVVFRSVSPSDQKILFDMIEDKAARGFLLSELDEATLLRTMENMSVEEAVEILRTMPADDVADVIGKLPDSLADSILKKMNKEESLEVEGLLSYGDDTAGGIMVPDFVAVKQDVTAAKAIESLQKEYIDVEMPFYLYVVDDQDRLLGVVSLRQLVVVPPDTPLREFMNTDIVSVRTDTDQEEVARIVAHYNILAVPVVDANGRLVGIVTVDDVIDIIREEATEDILKMAGVGDKFVEAQSLGSSARIRLPWLFASCTGGILASMIIGHFSGTLQKVSYVAAFIPVIMGMGGNIGNQSSTLVVRGLAMGRIQLTDLWRVVAKEMCVGFILGLFYAVVLASVVHIAYSGWALSGAVSLALIFSMSMAALMGSLFPLAFARLHIDPAVATGPFVSTSVDVLSVFFYFQVATFFLDL